jgi:putative intracellular protease/amidase
MVKILCVLTSDEHGFYLPEIAHPFHRFKAAGFDVDICSIKGGKAPVSPQSIDLTDEENKNFYETESIWKLTENTATLSSYDASAYDGVFYVGGFGTMWDFPESPVNNIYILQNFSSNLIFSHS